MATYNGAKYVVASINSILCQCDESAELIVVDDGSKDGTRDLLQRMDDPRLRVVFNETNLGVICNFNKALSLASGDIVFLSDQDDLWIPSRIEAMLATFELDADVCCVRHGVIFMDADGRELDLPSEFPRRTFFSNWARNSFRGCTMAIDRRLLSLALPLPPQIPMHDHWIGLCSYLVGKEVYLPTPLLYYRRHESNVSRTMSHLDWPMIASRWHLLRQLVQRALTRGVLRSKHNPSRRMGERS